MCWICWGCRSQQRHKAFKTAIALANAQQSTTHSQRLRAGNAFKSLSAKMPANSASLPASAADNNPDEIKRLIHLNQHLTKKKGKFNWKCCLQFKCQRRNHSCVFCWFTTTKHQFQWLRRDDNEMSRRHLVFQLPALADPCSMEWTILFTSAFLDTQPKACSTG